MINNAIPPNALQIKQKANTEPAGEHVMVQQIPLHLIDMPKLLLRDIDEQAVTDLAFSIRKHGVLQPIQLRTKEDGKYEVVFGNHRFQAARRAGLSVIPASVKDFDEHEALLLALAENIQRVEMNPVKEGEIYVRLLNGNLSTASVVALSKEVGKSVDYTKTRITICQNLNPILRNQIGKTLTITNAEMLSRSPRDQQEEIYKRMQEAKFRLSQKTHEDLFSKEPANNDKPSTVYCICPRCLTKHVQGIEGMGV